MFHRTLRIIFILTISLLFLCVHFKFHMAHSMRVLLCNNEGATGKKTDICGMYLKPSGMLGATPGVRFRRGRCFRSENTPKSDKEGYHFGKVYPRE